MNIKQRRNESIRILLILAAAITLVFAIPNLVGSESDADANFAVVAKLNNGSTVKSTIYAGYIENQEYYHVATKKSGYNSDVIKFKLPEGKVYAFFCEVKNHPLQIAYSTKRVGNLSDILKCDVSDYGRVLFDTIYQDNYMTQVNVQFTGFFRDPSICLFSNNINQISSSIEFCSDSMKDNCAISIDPIPKRFQNNKLLGCIRTTLSQQHSHNLTFKYDIQDVCDEKISIVFADWEREPMTYPPDRIIEDSNGKDIGAPDYEYNIHRYC